MISNRAPFLLSCLLPIALGLSACGGGGDGETVLERLSAGAVTAPDEFMVLPRKPLELPPDLTELPTPQPGATSRSDLTPITDAEVALSGRPGRAPAIPADRALLAATGTGAAGIRQTLSAEDEQWRSRNRGRLLERLFRRTDEGIVYRRQILDAEAELLRLRDAGIWVPPLPAQ